MDITQGVQLEIKMNDIDAVYSIKGPTIGQLMAIESYKIRYTNGDYGLFTEQKTVIADMQLNTADALAFYSAMCPELLKELKVNVTELNAIDGAVLIHAYQKQILPWLNEWYAQLVIATNGEDNSKEDSIEDVKDNSTTEEK